MGTDKAIPSRPSGNPVYGMDGFLSQGMRDILAVAALLLTVGQILTAIFINSRSSRNPKQGVLSNSSTQPGISIWENKPSNSRWEDINIPGTIFLILTSLVFLTAYLGAPLDSEPLTGWRYVASWACFVITLIHVIYMIFLIANLRDYDWGSGDNLLINTPRDIVLFSVASFIGMIFFLTGPSWLLLIQTPWLQFAFSPYVLLVGVFSFLGLVGATFSGILMLVRKPAK